MSQQEDWVSQKAVRNFPHQVNRIDKIRAALQIASQLGAEDRDIGDDAILGYALAQAGIYAFRNLAAPSPRELQAAITREQRKPASNQGPRTFARDLRRTLALLGFLEQRADSSWQVSDLGERVLAYCL